jgi:ABC-type amino acid transport substrate-binding protein
MKKALLSIILLISLSAYTQTGELKLVSDIWPPFTNVEGEKAFAMDLVKEALARINIKTSFHIQEFNDLIKGIDAGEFDGSAALWRSEEREEKYLFSEPYLQNQLVLVGKKGCDVSATTFTDCGGKRLGVVEDYSYGVDINSDSVSLISGKNDQQNLERLLSDQIDFMLVDALLIQYLLQYQFNDVTEYLEIGKSPIIIKSLHFALRKDINDAENIIAKFNEEIHEMIAEGTYNRILELNWVRADMDGDGQMELILDGNAAGTAPPEYAYGVFSDQSLVKKTDSPERYYIKGRMYNSWDQIPQEYKTEIIMSTQNPKDAGIKLNF